MRLLITGATGFIGRALVSHLNGSGNQLAALVRDEVKARALLGNKVGLIASGQQADLQKAVSSSDAIINLAGEPVVGQRWTEDRKQRIITSRVELTRQIVAAIKQSTPRPTVLISASAIGYYGDCGSTVVSDDHPPASDFLARLCQDWEAAALEARSVAIRVFIPRIGIVLGPEGGALAKMITPFRMGLGGPIGSGNQYVPWIHLADMIGIITQAVEDSRFDGPMIAAAPNPVTNREFSQTLARLLHRPCVIPAPAFALKIALGEAAAPLLNSQRVAPERLAEAGFAWRYTTIDAALKDLIGSA
ncbi:MAG TPA: TIGR01777 family oxidoreductase [Candidatus Binataceae bacterium]|nr:TIGR01777 family oxidoreductase [Candidatus Binataceae bacterium]